ncbi:MAG TPA: glycosyltransferase family 39 protein, partial [Anaerolineae bacterium]|nr:glycosyltransferase family 39 protein [Anaerolineae bacterium]
MSIVTTPRAFRHQMVILGIILVSWSLLVWQLGRRSLWVDEFLSLEMSRGGLHDVIAASTADLHPPLYFLALRAWTALAGTSDFAVRWLSTAAGIVGVALTVVVTRRLTGRRAAAAATWLLGLAPAFVEFSRMARYYSLVLMLGLLSTWLLLDAMERNDPKRWSAYALTGLAMLYTFYPSGVLLVAHVLMIVLPVRRRASIRNWLIAAGAIGIGFAPWLGAIASGQITVIAGSTGADLARSGLGFALGVAASLYTFSVGETIFPWHPAAWLGMAIVVLLVIAGLRQRAERGRWPSAGVALLSIGFISATTTFVSVGTPFLNAPVRALFALPFYLLVAAIGVSRVGSARLRSGLAGALLAVWGIGIVNYFTGQQPLN